MATKDDYANNTSTQGKLNVPGDITGSIETQGDHDWFKVSLEAGKAYKFSATTPYDDYSAFMGLLLDPWVDIYDVTGNLMHSGSLYIPTISGDYYIDVGDYFNENTGDYSLISATDLNKENFVAGRHYIIGSVELSNQSNAYVPPSIFDSTGTQTPFAVYSDGLTIYFVFSPKKSGTYYSPYSFDWYTDDFGDSIEAASPQKSPTLKVPITIQGQNEVSFERDFFSMTLKAGISYKFEWTLDSSKYLTIFNAAGKVVVDTLNTQQSLKPYLLFTAQQSGKYYFEIEEADTLYDYNYSSAYSIKISQVGIINGTPNNDVLQGRISDDFINGGLGNDILNGSSGNDTLNGGAGIDRLNGDNGNDILNGSSGKDTMLGGRGNDLYIVDNKADVVLEKSTLLNDIDTVQSTVNYTLRNFSLPTGSTCPNQFR